MDEIKFNNSMKIISTWCKNRNKSGGLSIASYAFIELDTEEYIFKDINIFDKEVFTKDFNIEELNKLILYIQESKVNNTRVKRYLDTVINKLNNLIKQRKETI